MGLIAVAGDLTYNSPGILRVWDDLYAGLWSTSALTGLTWRFEPSKAPKNFRFQLVMTGEVDFVPWASASLMFDTRELEGQFVWGAAVPTYANEPIGLLLCDVPGTFRIRSAWN